jgi:membrane-associated protease RseP (regulator of RpoE activity)
MVKALWLVAAGLLVGLGVMYWVGGDAPPSVAATTSGAGIAATAVNGDRASTDRIAQLEAALTAEVQQRTALEAKVAALGEELAKLKTPPADTEAGAAADPAGDAPQPGGFGPPRFARNGAAWRGDPQGREREALIAAGFAPDRAEWIAQRTSELRMQALQAQYDAAREGKPPTPGQGFGGDSTLRAELGDADYERYLQALGRPTSVPVQGVLASSPAERSGLKPGDEVVAYNGKRVFDMRELNALTLEGTAGESIAVSVRRDGQTIQLTLPRGPLGIVGGGFRGR